MKFTIHAYIWLFNIRLRYKDVLKYFLCNAQENRWDHGTTRFPSRVCAPREIFFSIFLYNYNTALWIGVIAFLYFICSFFRLVIKSYLSISGAQSESVESLDSPYFR